MAVNNLLIARESGAVARKMGDSRDSCLWPDGPARDAWLQAYDMASDQLARKQRDQIVVETTTETP